jgi:D-glycero-D-manno-heptose 1,7-bisphosphate phosphatase
MKKLIILDRDGVINVNLPQGINNINDFVLLPGSLQGLLNLAAQGYLLAIATNQGAINTKKLTIDTLNAIHLQLQNSLQMYNVKIAKICYCPHTELEQCVCRKPKPGMLWEILQYFAITNYKEVYFVGDNITDVKAAQSAGVTPVLVKTGWGVNTLTRFPELAQKIIVCEDLLSFSLSLD